MSKGMGKPNPYLEEKKKRTRQAVEHHTVNQRPPQPKKASDYGQNTERRRHTSKKKKPKRGIIITCCVVIVIGILISFFAFFNVNNVEVNGSSKYTKAQICSAGDIEIGDNLFLTLSSKDIDMLQKKLPYISKVEVKRQLPSTLIINVTETEAFFAVYYENEYILLDGNMKILEKTSSISGLNIAEIKGVTPQSVVLGENMQFKNRVTDETSTEELKETETDNSLINRIIAALIEENFSGVTCIDISDRMNIKIDYKDRITVNLGASTELNYKLGFAKETIGRIGDNESGILDVSVPKSAYFKNIDLNEGE